MMVEGGGFQKLGFTRPQRKGLFFGVCIWVRLALAVGVYFAARHFPQGTAIVVLVGSLILVVGNAVQRYLQPNVWWSRLSHIILGSASSVTSTLVLGHYLPAITLSIFVALDPIFGIISALVVQKP